MTKKIKDVVCLALILVCSGYLLGSVIASAISAKVAIAEQIRKPIPSSAAFKIQLFWEATAAGLNVKDIRFLAEAARRESRWDEDAININHNKNGATSTDYGLLQVNDKAWDAKAQELGLDYQHSTIDNIKMAIYIYQHQGKGAWVSMRYK